MPRFRAAIPVVASFSVIVSVIIASPAGAQAVPPTLEACYVPASGTIYRIDVPSSPAPGAPKTCFSVTHVRFAWNQAGPIGPKGEKGDPGANGVVGPDLTLAGTLLAKGVGVSGNATVTGSLAVGPTSSASGPGAVALGADASTNGRQGVFAFGDASGGSVLKASADNQFLVRAAGGVRLRTAADQSKGCDIDVAGSLTCTGSVVGAPQLAGGDLSGTLPSPTVAKLRGVPVEATTPQFAQFLRFDGKAWVPHTPSVSISVIEVQESVVVGVSSTNTVQANCPAGATRTGGGAWASQGDMKLRMSTPIGTKSWYASARNDHVFDAGALFAVAICASVVFQ